MAVIDTKECCIFIGYTNLILSILSMIGFILYITLLNAVAYEYCGIGLFASFLHCIFCLMLINGVQNRKSSWVHVYVIMGTVSIFFQLLSLVLGLNFIYASAIVGAVLIGAAQVYFLVVIYSEYKNIVQEKEIETLGLGLLGLLGLLCGVTNFVNRRINCDKQVQE